MTSLPPRVRLVVLFGGRSAEHDISCVSATHVLAAIDPQRYDVVPIGITRSGGWVLAPRTAELSVPTDAPEVDPLPVLTAGAATGDVPTVVLPILHGPNGEDGTVQGLLELAGIPYVGSGVLGSAVCMDKVMAKTVLDAAGIAQVRWRSLPRHRAFGEAEARTVLDDLGPTVFVKPANMGSSIGVSKATDTLGLLAAVAEAFRYDDLVVFEEGVVARELECAVLGNDEPRASVVGEIVTAADFYDYRDKYVDSTALTVVPAELDGTTSDAVRALAVRTFESLRCAGLARVDVFLEETAVDGGPGRGVLVNEVNTIPGFTPISMYPKLWEASGLGYPELIDELVRLALERHGMRASHEVTAS